MNKKQVIRLNETDLHGIVKRSVNKVLRERINDITPLSTHIQNNQDADLEALGNFVDDLRKVKEGGALSKWNPTIASISFPFLSNKSKAAVKRAQSQTCLNYAEREQSRRKVNKSNKSNKPI